MAFARSIDLLGETPKRLIGLGESLVYKNNGIVTEDARRAWGRLLEVAPDHAEGRFWLALADEQDGRFANAADAYRRLLASSPPDAPWRPTVTERLGIVEKRLGGVRLPSERAPVAEASPKGPTAADIAAAGQMAPADRLKMIEQMVAGLSERLRTSGGDIESWERLVRSYTILGRRDDAVKALADARRALSGDSAHATRLDALAKSLGLGG